MERIPLAREIMFSPLRITPPSVDIYVAMEMLAQRDVPAGIVLEESGAVIGVLTEKDCLRVLSADAYEGQGVLHPGTVRDFMSPLKVSLAPDCDLFSIAAAFLQTNFTWLPVMEGDQLAGCVSRRGMLQKIREMQRALASRKHTDTELQKAVHGPATLSGALLVAREKQNCLRQH